MAFGREGEIGTRQSSIFLFVNSLLVLNTFGIIDTRIFLGVMYSWAWKSACEEES